MANLKFHYDPLVASFAAERLLSIRRVGEIEYRDLYLRRPRYDFSQIITSLEDKIYVAKSSEILVYKNKSPYESLKSIEIGVHGLPDTIASCSINKCLYISFPESRLVFKVEPQFENRVSKWLEMEKTYLPNISVTSIGDVLVLYVLPDLSREDDEREDNELVIFTPEGTLKRTIILKFRLGQIKSIHEIMPDVAVIYEKVSKSDLTRIVIMRLNEAGTILRDIAWQQEISSLSSFRYGDLLIGTFGYINDANNSFDQVHIWTLASKAEQNLLTTDESIYSIHFAADQKQLYILRPYRIDVYQLNYEDEDCGT